MKQTILIISLFFGSYLNSLATVYTVLNFPAGIAQFDNIQAACDSANHGDTIYIHGSIVPYAQFTVDDKKLIYIGPGFATEKISPISAKLGIVTIRNFSNIIGTSSGTEFHGLEFTSALTLGGIGTNGEAVNNVLVNRCYFNGGSGTNFTFANNGRTHANIIIQNCYFSYYILDANFSSGYLVNFLFRNNVVRPATITPFFSGFSKSSGVVIDHNLFYGNGAASPLFGNSITQSPNNSYISNNIFVGVSNLNFGFNNSYQNNITFNTTSTTIPWATPNNFDLGSNISQTDPQLVSQADINSGVHNTLLNFKPNTGSPCIGAGNDGLDMGLIFTPNSIENWNLSRNGVLPYIVNTAWQSSNTVSQGGTIQVQIEARKSK
ncbi:MAG: hypothetical protein R2831_02575 [Chitinophagaceae bacterium]